MLEVLLKLISGEWYQEYVYFRFRIHKRSFPVRLLARLFFAPFAVWVRVFHLLSGRLAVPHVEISIMHPCHVACQDCAHINPNYLSSDLEPEQLIQDLEDFLGKVDRIHRLIVVGYEPLLYPNLCRILSYLIEQRKVDFISVVTPGSVIPTRDVLNLLRHNKVLVTVSRFAAGGIPGPADFLRMLEKENINYVKRDIWRDLGSFNPAADTDKQAFRNRFARCIHKSFYQLNGGAFYLCPRSAHASRLHQGASDRLDRVVFRDGENPHLFKQELRTLFRRKYLAACQQCAGSFRETKLEKLLNKLVGSWYREHLYYRYRIFAMPLWRQKCARLLFLPAAAAVKIYDVALRNLEIPRVEMPITTRCTFLCRDCGNLIPFYRKRNDYDLEELIRDVKDFLANVGRVNRFIVMGGETFLYRDLKKLILFLIRQDKINLIHLFTNGSVIPEKDVLDILRHRKVLITISSFPLEVSPRKPLLISALKENHINYQVDEKQWMDRGGWDPEVDNSEEGLRHRFAACPVRICHRITRGEYHLCPRSDHGEQLRQFVPDESDKITFRGMRNPQKFKEELRRLMKKEYIQACTKCKGAQGGVISPGVQMRGENGS
jgi:hypothetical protein